MKIKIKLLKPFSDAVGKNELYIDFNGLTLGDLVETLVERYPLLKKEIYIEKESLTDFICIFVNDKPFSTLNGLKSELHNEDEVLFFIPISGG
ncbi:MAG: MoaD family protein, partial [Candidatus Thermoplasmatota archaeon]|nr:MoaD family protein [Candidatus Thermoplasmatota archaeon]